MDYELKILNGSKSSGTSNIPRQLQDLTATTDFSMLQFPLQVFLSAGFHLPAFSEASKSQHFQLPKTLKSSYITSCPYIRKGWKEAIAQH